MEEAVARDITISGDGREILRATLEAKSGQQRFRLPKPAAFKELQFYGWNKPEWLHLCHDATAQLTGMTGRRPVYAWIETSKGGQSTGPLERQKDVTPVHILRRGVDVDLWRGDGHRLLHACWSPPYKSFGVPDTNREALGKINEQITRLAPAILGRPCESRIKIASGGINLAALGKRHDDHLYLFAVDDDERSRKTDATVEIEDLPAGSEVTVIDEGRVIRSDAGSFRDTFEPLAVHLYRLPMPPAR